MHSLIGSQGDAPVEVLSVSQSLSSASGQLALLQVRRRCGKCDVLDRPLQLERKWTRHRHEQVIVSRHVDTQPFFSYKCGAQQRPCHAAVPYTHPSTFESHNRDWA